MTPDQTIHDKLDIVDTQYTKALAHTRLVQLLKYTLPVLGIFIILGLIGIPYVYHIFSETLVIRSADIFGDISGDITMSAPVLAGRNDKNQPYSIKAERAIQKTGNSPIITFENIKALLPVNEDHQAILEAKEGIFNQTDKKLTFNKPFIIAITPQINARFLSAEYDITSGNFTSHQNIDIKMPGTHLTANKITLSHNGKNVILEDHVKMSIMPHVIQRNQERTIP